MTTADKIGKVNLEIADLSTRIASLTVLGDITQPELLGANHQEVSELTAKLDIVRTEWLSLKEQHKRELLNKLRGIKSSIEIARERREQEELEALAKDTQGMIDLIDEQVGKYHESKALQQ